MKLATNYGTVYIITFQMSLQIQFPLYLDTYNQLIPNKIDRIYNHSHKEDAFLFKMCPHTPHANVLYFKKLIP